MNTRGFTLIEMLVVVLLIGILANLAIPGIQDAKRKSQAAAVIGDVKVIETALFDYSATNGDMPPSASWGNVPSGFASSLPGDFSFDTGTVMFRWQRFRQAQQLRRGQYGRLRIRSDDHDLIRSVKGLYQQGSTTGSGSTLVIYID